MKAVDWFVMVKVSLMWTVSTVFLFMHPTEAVFIAWCGFGGTVTAVYHWMTIRDQKIPDANNG